MHFPTFRQLLAASSSIIMAVLLSLVTPIVQAGTTLAPIVLEIGTTDRTSLTITNQSQRRVPYQLSLLAWKQINGQDEYSPSDDLLISPAALTLIPGATQEIRIGFRERSKRGNSETAYRVMIEELPDVPTQPTKSGLVQITVKHLIPLYVSPADLNAAPVLRWSIKRDGDLLRIRSENDGNRHMLIRDLMITSTGLAGPSVHPKPKGRAIVLAKSWREWSTPIPTNDSAQDWTLLITDQFGQVNQQNIKLQPR